MSVLEAPFALADEPAVGFDEAALHTRHPVLATFAARLGRTPLVELPGPAGGATIVAKCEWFNPTGSVKDRVAYAMLCDVLDRGDVSSPLIEYSGGNLALSLSTLCHALDLHLRVVLSSASPRSLLDVLSTNGTDVTLVDKELGFIAVIDRAIALSEENPSFRLLFQHRNQVNVAYHQATTGRELVDQLDGRRVAAWVASVGTGGTLVGVARALHASGSDAEIVCVTPSELPYGSFDPPNGLPKYGGSGGFGNGIKQPFVRAAEGRISKYETVSYAESLDAMLTIRENTGLRVGSSSGANWLAAFRMAATLTPDETVATILPCQGTPEEWKRITE